MWAFVVGGAAWLVFAGAAALLGVSAIVKYVFANKSMKDSGVPGRTVVLGGLLGIVGFFVIPVVGLFVGFLVGLLLSETVRNRNLNTALASSWVAAKAMGVGLLLELTCALLASLTFIVGAITYFVTA